MRHFLCAVALVLVPCAAGAQDKTVTVPSTVTVEGMPAIPQEIADGLAKYARFTRAILLDWSPSGRRMLLQIGPAGAQVYQLDSPGAKANQVTKEARPVTSLNVFYDPADANSFVFMWDPTGGREANQIYRYDLSAGKATLLTDGHAKYQTPVWARGGKQLAFTSTRRNGTDWDLYVTEPAKPDSERLVAQLTGQWSVSGWSPDDTSLLLVETIASTTESNLWRVDVKTGEKTLFTPKGDVPVVWSNPQFGADGTVFAISDRGADLERLWKRDAKGQWSAITPEGQRVVEFAISSEAALIAVALERQASVAIEIFDAKTMKPTASPDLPPGRLATPPPTRLRWRPGSHELGFSYETVTAYGEIYSFDVDTKSLTNWKQSTVSGFDASALPPAEIVSWKSFDGRMISGVYYRPPASFKGPRPVMINIHGGPADREQPRFIGRSDYFVNELGIALIYPNVRGSGGFGRVFSHLDDKLQREGAVKDIGALLDWIGAQPSLDKDRVMVTGASYGGWLTLMVAAEYSDRIRCAFEGAGMTDLPTFLEQRGAEVQQDRREEYGDERDPAVRAFLTRMSPLTHAAEIKKPLMIAHGGNDVRIPADQAEKIAKAVKDNGVPVWYLLYKSEGHDSFVTRSAELNNFNFAAWVLFSKTYLLN